MWFGRWNKPSFLFSEERLWPPIHCWLLLLSSRRHCLLFKYNSKAWWPLFLLQINAKIKMRFEKLSFTVDLRIPSNSRRQKHTLAENKQKDRVDKANFYRVYRLNVKCFLNAQVFRTIISSFCRLLNSPVPFFRQRFYRLYIIYVYRSFFIFSFVFAFIQWARSHIFASFSFALLCPQNSPIQSVFILFRRLPFIQKWSLKLKCWHTQTQSMCTRTRTHDCAQLHIHLVVYLT